ncbi:MAG: enoyl-CoA hydratase-related protein [Bryobacteraceae bacterium]
MNILYSVAEGVASVTLNRPEKLNAWTAAMEQEFTAAVRGAESDAAARVILVRGAGRAFCAGADMSLLQDAAAGGGIPLASRAGEPIRRHAWLMDVAKPIVAAIHGPAVGLGFILPLYCDLRVAAPEATFCSIFSRRGLTAEFGAAWILPRLVGQTNAMDLLLTSRTLDAAEALRIGLVSRILPASEFDAFARDLAASVSPRSTAVIKRQVRAAQFQTFTEAYDAGSEEMRQSLQCADFREGVAHFIEKRPPRFTGK